METEIEWTRTRRDDGATRPGYTFNPWWGCAKVSPGCMHCYADTSSHRWGFDIWGADKSRRMMSDAYWSKPLKWDKDAASMGERRRVFCASMADVFEDREDLHAPRERLWKLIAATPNLDWLLLTKRPQNMKYMLPWMTDAISRGAWANVWLGTSVESQTQAEKRIPRLLEVPAVVRFLSVEPLLELVDLDYWITEPEYGCGKCGCQVVTGMGRTIQQEKELLGRCVRCDQEFGKWANRIHWVIVGGESGASARPMHPAWAVTSHSLFNRLNRLSRAVLL